MFRIQIFHSHKFPVSHPFFPSLFVTVVLGVVSISSSFQTHFLEWKFRLSSGCRSLIFFFKLALRVLIAFRFTKESAESIFESSDVLTWRSHYFFFWSVIMERNSFVGIAIRVSSIWFVRLEPIRSIEIPPLWMVWMRLIKLIVGDLPTELTWFHVLSWNFICAFLSQFYCRVWLI